MENKKDKYIKLIIDIFLVFFVILLGISVYKMISYKKDQNNVNEELNIINDNSNVTEVTDSEDTQIITNEDIDEFNPYWDYIKMNLIDVNFDNLKEINSDVKGWIQVNGTNINFPFVQTTNNEYYLTHSFDKSYNEAGWVFLDYRNTFNDKNTILYAHARVDNTMFGSLRNLSTSGWLNNSDNFVIKLSTETENTLWQVFSLYHVPTTSDYLKIDFSSDEEFNEFTNMLINRSIYDFGTTVSNDDRIITLSTCYGTEEKMVLHAKLIKKEDKIKDVTNIEE